MGTKGFFPEYKARPDANVTRAEAVEWLWKWMQFQKPRLQAAIDDANSFSDLRPDQSGFIAAHSLQHWKVLAPSPQLRPNDLLTSAEAKEWLLNATKMLGWPKSLFTEAKGAFMTRAEFCQWIYDAQSSVDDSRGKAKNKS